MGALGLREESIARSNRKQIQGRFIKWDQEGKFGSWSKKAEMGRFNPKIQYVHFTVRRLLMVKFKKFGDIKGIK